MEWLKRLFTPSMTTVRRAQAESNRIQEEAAARAAAEQERAARASQAALTNAADSEPARQAAEQRMRRLMAQRGMASTIRGGGGLAPVGYKTLMGS